jgi:Lrp/AsnC family transcriptional regulator for asnA, asnC and gidA
VTIWLTQCAGILYNRFVSSAPASGRGPVNRPRSLDIVDRGIIEALQSNGRESFRAIATKLGVAEATVRARYARLVEDDVLQVIGITNPLGLGFEAQALLGVNTAGASEPVADELSSWSESSYVVIAAGRFDVLVEVLCVDRRHLLELTNRIRAIPGVVSTETFPYLQLAKQVYGWGLLLEHEAKSATA